MFTEFVSELITGLGIDVSDSLSDWILEKHIEFELAGSR